MVTFLKTAAKLRRNLKNEERNGKNEHLKN